MSPFPDRPIDLRVPSAIRSIQEDQKRYEVYLSCHPNKCCAIASPSPTSDEPHVSLLHLVRGTAWTSCSKHRPHDLQCPLGALSQSIIISPHLYPNKTLTMNPDQTHLLQQSELEAASANVGQSPTHVRGRIWYLRSHL